MIGKEHDGKMTEREVMPRLPSSGQILGALVGRLGIKHETLRDRTARRYFASDLEHLVKDSTREKIIAAMAEVLADSGFVASQQVREDSYGLGTNVGLHADVARGSLGPGEIVHSVEGQ